MASMHKSEEDSDVIYDLTSDFKAIGPLIMNFVRIQNLWTMNICYGTVEKFKSAPPWKI